MLEVTVVMATYNGGRHLQEQLDSLVAQDRLPARLHVSDDGSTDSTWQILQTFAGRAPFAVDLVQQRKRLGAQENFARAVSEIRGDVLLFCDQDDRWHRDKIASVVALFEGDERIGMVINDATLTDHRLHPIGRTLFEQHRLEERDFALIRDGRAFRIFARKMPPYGSTTALRPPVARAALPMPEGQTYDQWIGQLAALHTRVAVIRASLQDYRQHGAQVTGIPQGSKVSQVLRRRQTHNRTELDRDVRRLQQLRRRLAGMDQQARPVAEAVRLTSGRLALERRRQAVRSRLVVRPFAIGLLLLSGAYHLHARGFRSAGLDLVARR